MKSRISVSLRNDLWEIDRLAAQLEDFARTECVPSRVVLDINLALEEVLTNVINYAYPDPGDHYIVVNVTHDGSNLCVEIEDQGKPFDPLAFPAADTTLHVEERGIGGLGIHLTRKLMDGVEYRREGNKNILTLTKASQKES